MRPTLAPSAWILVLTLALLGCTRREIVTHLRIDAALEDRTPATSPGRIRRSWDTMHEFYTNEFVSAPGFGASRLPRRDLRLVVPIGEVEYGVTRIDLLGAASGLEPLVYERARDELMIVRRELERATTRAPNAQEEDGLSRIRKGEPWVLLEEKSEPLRLMGALRARIDCALCHEVAVGDLLGAFVYTLGPASDVDGHHRVSALRMLAPGKPFVLR